MILLALGGCADDVDRDSWGIPDHYPSLVVPQDNPMTVEKVELGRHLFYDFRLSVNGKRSCGVCHEGLYSNAKNATACSSCGAGRFSGTSAARRFP